MVGDEMFNGRMHVHCATVALANQYLSCKGMNSQQRLLFSLFLFMEDYGLPAQVLSALYSSWQNF